jgi:hypothetical protein
MLALAPVVPALPAQIALPAPPPANAAPSPSTPAPARRAPKVSTPGLPAISLPIPGVRAPSLPKPPRATAPRLVPWPLAAPSGAADAVTRVVTPLAPLAPLARPAVPTIAREPVARALALPLRDRSSGLADRTRQSADGPSAASGSSIRSLRDGGEVRIVPRDVCSTQVASAYPETPALCTTVTPEVAAELGLTPGPDGSPIAGVAGLAVTGASIIGLAIIGALLFGLGGVFRPLRGSRARRRAAPA